MKIATDQFDGGYITYNNDSATRDAVFEKLLAWFVKFKAFDGDSIMQCDGPNLDSPNILGELADNVFKFDPTWEG